MCCSPFNRTVTSRTRSCTSLGRRGWFATLLLFSCEPASSVGPPPQTPVAVAPQVAPPTAPPPAVNQLRFVERASAVLPGDWKVDFGRPCVAKNAEGAFNVALSGELDVPGYSLFLRYDGYLARPVPPLSSKADKSSAAREIALKSLMDEWGELRDGKHRLVVFAAGAEDQRVPEMAAGRPALSICDIEVADGQATELSTGDTTLPRVVLTSPEGTLHGEVAADSAHLELFVLPRARAATLVVERPDGGQDRHQLESGTYSIDGLRSGDYRFSAGFVASDGFASGGLWTPHVISVNRDAK